MCLAGLVVATGAGPTFATDPPPADPAAQGVVRMTQHQALAFAQIALRKGQPKTAYELTEGLIKANPKNGHAHFIRASALGQLKDYRTGKRSAAAAYRAANTNVQRYEAAKLAAELSFAGDQPTLSQLWLRRATHYAPDDKTRSNMVRAFRGVRNSNPLRFQLSFSVNPSDNINNGANSPLNIIEGSPLVGTLSTSAQAISGTVIKTEAHLSYRLRQAEGSETHATGRVVSREYRFNNPVWGLSASDLSSLRAQIGLRHYWLPDKIGYWRFDLTAGRAWYGGDPYYDFVGLGIQRSRKLNDKTRLNVGFDVEQQYGKDRVRVRVTLLPTTPPTLSTTVRPEVIADATVYSAFAEIDHDLNNGGQIGARVQYREIDSAGANRASQQWSTIATYELGKEIGPAEVSFSLGYSSLDYDAYSVIVPVPGGRRDTSWFGGVTATFNDYSYFGFVPVVTLNAEKSRSNISRFDVDQTAVSFGIRSEF